MNHYLAYIMLYFSILINWFVFFYCYNKLANTKIKIKKVIILCLIIFSFIILYINIFANISYKWLIAILMLLLFCKICFKESIFETFIKVLFIYLFTLISDFLSSIILILIPIFLKINNNFLIIISTFIVSLMIFIIFNIKNVIIIINKIIKNMLFIKKSIFILLVMLGVFAIGLVSYINVVEKSYLTYFVSLFILLIYILLSIILIFQYFKNKQSEKEQELLIKLIEDYEKLLESDKENRHEILNNLITLKSIKNKSTKSYENTLDEIISKYQYKKTTTYANLYKLPKGIKGIIYYKMYNINDKNITFSSFISNECYKLLENMNSKLYYNLCELLGILIDNAIDACSVSTNKNILIDIYLENNIINLYLENDFNGNISINDINKNGFTTKGKNHGYGLKIANKIVKKTKEIDLIQKINNDKFISIIKIKL